MRSYRFLLASTLAVTLSLAACSSDPAQDSPPIEDMDSADASTTPATTEDMSSIDEDMNPNNTSTVDMPSTTIPEDMSQEVDMSAGEDMASNGEDMSDMSTDMTADMTPTEDMATEVDMALPARPEGQCSATSDCGDERLTCNRQAVGGICQGTCDACDNIPDAYTYSCVQGSCVRDCDTDDDCSPGRYCTGSGRCAIERCVDNVCPSPLFGCTSPDGICQRFSCDAMTPCPQGTACDNGVCIEQ